MLLALATHPARICWCWMSRFRGGPKGPAAVPGHGAAAEGEAPYGHSAGEPYLRLVRKYADHVVLLDKTVLAQGSPADVFATPEFSAVFGTGEEAEG